MKAIKDLGLKDNAKLSGLTKEKLTQELKDSEKKLFSLKMKKGAGELKQTHLVKFLRRYVAKLNTFLSVK